VTVTVHYRLERPYSRHFGGPPRPYLAVQLRNGATGLDTLALVDSGADSSLFHKDFALALGFVLDPVEARTTVGVGGSVPTWYFDIVLFVAGKHIPSRVAFADGWRGEYGLLGRGDFFRAFRVGFDEVGARLLLAP
jgi:hypothetical protein